MKNNKGFTLVELLAVIVVLAVIMVIATTSISNVIAKNRADSFVSTAKVVYSTLKQCAAQGLTAAECKEMIDISDDYRLAICDWSGTYKAAYYNTSADTEAKPDNHLKTAYCSSYQDYVDGYADLLGAGETYIYTYTLIVNKDGTNTNYIGHFKNMSLNTYYSLTDSNKQNPTGTGAAFVTSKAIRGALKQ